MISRLEVSRSAANQNSIQTLKQRNFFLTPSHHWNKQSYKRKQKTKNNHAFATVKWEKKLPWSIQTTFWVVPIFFYSRKYSSGCCGTPQEVYFPFSTCFKCHLVISATAKKVLLFVGNISPYLLHDMFLKVFDNLMHYGENQANIRKPTTNNQKPASEPSDYSSYP